MVWRRRPDSNRCMEVLQTSALPLGYGAAHSRSYHDHARVVNESRHGRDFVRLRVTPHFRTNVHFERRFITGCHTGDHVMTMFPTYVTTDPLDRDRLTRL